jgi:hypothetical protein
MLFLFLFPTSEFVVPVSRLARPAIDALSGKPDGVDEKNKKQHRAQKGHSPNSPCRRRNQGGDKNKKKLVLEPFAIWSLFFEVTKEYATDRRDAGDHRDFKP